MADRTHETERRKRKRILGCEDYFLEKLPEIHIPGFYFMNALDRDHRPRSEFRGRPRYFICVTENFAVSVLF